jgi:hypothetical protein
MHRRKFAWNIKEIALFVCSNHETADSFQDHVLHDMTGRICSVLAK